MRFFLVEGIIRAAENMDDAIMKQHMAYTQKAMDQGSICSPFHLAVALG